MGVLIVGGGPAGAATAFLLARAGVEVTLVERERDFERVFRGEGLMPSGVDALLQMGLSELLASLPSRRLEAWRVFIDGQEILSVPEPMEELGERAVRVVSQSALLEGLVREAARHPGFAFVRGEAVRDLVQADGRVVGARLQTREGTRALHADLVLGCDGRGSLVRKRAGLELSLLREHYDVAWFKVPAPPDLADGCSMMIFVSGRRACAAYTSWDGRLQLALTLPKGAYPALRDADWAAELSRVLPDGIAAHVAAQRAWLGAQRDLRFGSAEVKLRV